MITSNAMPYNEANGTQAIGKGTHMSTTPLIASLWKDCYTGIGRTNTFLDNIGNVTMDDALKSRMTGEAKFLRAFYYFYLSDRFGGVPLILETPNADKQASLPRDTKEAVVNQILKDLTEAAEVLPKYLSFEPTCPLERAGRCLSDDRWKNDSGITSIRSVKAV